MVAPSKSWTFIPDIDIAQDKPWTTDLVEDFRDNIEFLMEWLGGSFRAAAIVDHNHDGINSSLISIPLGGAMASVSWSGLGGAGDRLFIHAPVDPKSWIFMFEAPSTAERSGIQALEEDTFNQGSLWVGGLQNYLDGGNSNPRNPHLMAGSNNVDTAARFFHAIFMAEIEGLVAVGKFSGNATDNTAIDISDTSLAGHADFAPDGVLIYNASSGTEPYIRTDDHSGTNSSNAETGAFVVDAIKSLTSTGFTVGTRASVNGSGNNIFYLAWKAGSAGGLTIEKLTSPQNATEAYSALVNIAGVPMLALAIRTDATHTVGIQLKPLFTMESTLTGVDQARGLQVDAADETWVDSGIKELGKGRLRLGTGFPNLVGQNSNIWCFAPSNGQVFSSHVPT